MCDVITIGQKEFAIHDTFFPNGKVLIRTHRTNGRGEKVIKPIYWDGWAREEAIEEWLKTEHWKRADIIAERFSINTRRGRMEYEVPSHHAIKSIILETQDRMIVRILSREPVGMEAAVAKRFCKTGKISVI